MFHRANCNKKSFATNTTDNKMAADGWDSPKAILDIQWALANLAEVYAHLWPLDGSIRIIQRILIRYDYGAGLGNSDKDRVRIVEEFCDKILCENAARAARSAPYLPFETVKNRWRDAVEREPRTHSSQAASNSSVTPAKPAPTPSNRGGGNNNGGRGATRGEARGRGGWQARNAAAIFQGNAVCYHFNIRPPAGQASTCTRPPATGGCDNGRGGVYAHVCNFHSGGGVFCLQNHPRYANH